MELYTLDRQFLRQDVIEEFYSLIWTERYYGDGEVEVTVPLKQSLVDKLTEGTFLCIDKSKEPMFIETMNIEDGKLKVVGISIVSWLNNRFIRTSGNHRKTTWKLKNKKAGDVLGTIVREMCTNKSSWLNGPKDNGLTDAQNTELWIPGLKLGKQDASGKTIKKILVPYGPVYDALRKIAEQHKIGMQITLEAVEPYSLEFRTYKGLDRTSNQTVNPIVRFSPTMDSFADIKEVRSIAELKTLIYAFASNLEKIDTADANTNPDTWLQTTPGIARRTIPAGKYIGFDLRAKMIFPSDIKIKNDLDEEDDSGPEDTLSAKRAELRDVLHDRAEKELKLNKFIRTIDGSVAPTNLFQYGITPSSHYYLGDLIEVKGNTKITEVSQVTEYIRTQDESGEVSYPTVEAVEP